MNIEELKEFLKENLEINIVEHHAECGDGEWKTIEIMLCGETIDEAEF